MTSTAVTQQSRPGMDHDLGRQEVLNLAALVRECVASGIGRNVCIVHLSRLPADRIRPHHLRLARAALEPLANADPPHRADWLNTVKAATLQGQTVVSVLHDLNMALRADTVVVMHQGRVVMQASPQEAVLRDCLQEVFEHRLVFHEVQGQWLALPV